MNKLAGVITKNVNANDLALRLGINQLQNPKVDPLNVTSDRVLVQCGSFPDASLCSNLGIQDAGIGFRFWLTSRNHATVLCDLPPSMTYTEEK